jgi:hypothetical protein
VRPRELWLWLGAACLTAGTVLIALAVGYYLKEQQYSLSHGPQIIWAYILFALAFLFFILAILGYGPWLRLQSFPNIKVVVPEVGNSVGARMIPGVLPMPSRLIYLKVFIINSEADRNVCISQAVLRGRTKAGSPEGYWALFTQPRSVAGPVQAMDLPLNLGPRADAGGYLVFELEDYGTTNLATPGDFRVEIHEALSDKKATFPAREIGGVYRKRHGLQATTTAERVTGPLVRKGPLVKGPPWEMNWEEPSE